MDMPRPGEAHAMLEKLVGKWKGTEKLNPSPWDPKGGEAKGTVENRLALDGFAVIQDYTQKRDGKTTFRGHGVFFYDATAHAYRLHWWDSMGFPPNVFTGQFEEDTLTMTFAGSMGHHRVTFELPKKDLYRFKMEMSDDGQSWSEFMIGEYEREA